MKVNYSNNIYIQVIDLMWLNTLNIDMPSVVRKSIFNISYRLINNSISNTDFICFEDNEIIKYFNNLDWIIDYDEVKDLSLYELTVYRNNVKKECNNLIKKYNRMDYYDKLKNWLLRDRINYLNIKWLNVRDFILYRMGIIRYELPEGISKHRRKILK